jgi:hypothetical protein
MKNNLIDEYAGYDTIKQFEGGKKRDQVDSNDASMDGSSAMDKADLCCGCSWWKRSLAQGEPRLGIGSEV